jgi:hypothetical protein
LYFWQLKIANVNKMAIKKCHLELMKEVAVRTIQGGFTGGAQISSFGNEVPCGFHRSL